METSTPAPPAPAVATRPSPTAGQLTPGWRLVTAVTWILVFVALIGVWDASRKLGLSTWWLGPVSQPQPVPVMLVPFVAPVLMIVATVQNATRLPWYGLAASGVVAVVAAGDLVRVPRLGLVELAIAVAAAAVSGASLAGRYRAVRR